MFRAQPGRLSVVLFLPLALAGAQGLNAVVYGLASPLHLGFVLVMLGFAVGATRHSLAAFRAETLEASHLEGAP
ncbi:MAG: hypothetical protein ABEJ89_09325 [Haloarculaceae archaeon]